MNMKKENGRTKDKAKDKAGPVVDPAAAQHLNMMVLKRYDADIEEVLANSAHVTMYTLNVDTKQWARKQVEGSLFLIRRKTLPRFQLLVLNKLSTDNYVETLHDALDFEVHAPYLMYTHGNDEVVGVWFYENQDLEKVAGILNKIKLENPGELTVEMSPEVSPAAATAVSAQPIPATQEASAVNLQELLFRAHQRHQQQQNGHVSADKAANGQHRHAAATPAPMHTPVRPPPPQQQAPVSSHTTPSASAEPGKTPSPTTPALPPQEPEGNVLHKLFARAAIQPIASATNTPSPAAPQTVPFQQQPAQQRAQPDVTAVREKVRQAFSRLLQNDSFVDMLATEFRAVGLLP